MTVPTVGIIGGGISGITAAVQLKKKMGIEAQIFEASDNFGGTWYQNTYPGCACDVPSHLYSLSFDLNPEWSQRFSPQPEIHAYLSKVANKHQLKKQTSFSTEVVQALWIESERRWRLDWRQQGDTCVQSSFFDYIYVGVGSLRVAHIPEEFKGFQGTIVHTTHWDPTVDFTDKRVAIVGSGSSAIQAIPTLADAASVLYSYQRTPAWCIIRKQYHYSALFKFFLRYVPFVARIYRFYLFLLYELNYINFGYYSSYLGRLRRRKIEEQIRGRLEKSGRPDLVPALIPNYPPGCKRILQSEFYYEALCKDNVVLERTPIQSVEGRTITTQDGKEAEFDILVLATGFDVQGYLGNLKIYGKDEKVSLNEQWQKGFPDTYKTVTINGYPNLFMILGASSILGHNSVIIMGECQVDYSIRCMKYAIKHNLAAFEPEKRAQDEFVKNLKKAFEKTVWKGGCNSWYLNEEGDVTAIWSSTVTRFWLLLRKVDFSKFITYKRV
ncbi:putative flavo protein [Syncephalastrum racemosum]|uniref:Putative flavo protein n=1 Tax=Syncephalastrum racemosum TaxID=13706 RepID=A0A1X2HM84_SYNRA|nr:putative flavo protein [Syncephalastrum racemosum]